MLLGQPVTHTENGWQPDGPLTPWACKICESAYMEEGEQKAMLYGCCQQLTCTDCYYSQRFRHEDDCQGVPIIQREGDYQRVIQAYQEAVRSQAMEEEDYECADEGLDGPLLAAPDEAGNLPEGDEGASNAKKRRLTMAEVVKQCQNAKAVAMRIKAFDCIACGGAFDVDPNGAKAPVYTEGSLKCRMCLPGPTYLWAGR
ncbi:unnamed protein product, partial [Mesorhabditis spiculigera]